MNPLLKSYKYRLCYVAFWLLVSIAQMLTVHHFPVDKWYMLLDVLTYNTLYACLTLLLWYPFHFNRKENKSWLHYLFVHLAIACVFLALWQGVGYALVTLLTSSDVDYQQFLTSTMPWRMRFGALLYFIVLLVFFILDFVDQLRKKAENEIRLNEAIRESELKLLKSQINPHFLFNSLKCVLLSDFLRKSLRLGERPSVPLSEELDLAKNYFAIEQIRFGPRLGVVWDIDGAALGAEVPTLLLQPLVENAVKHGISQLVEGGTIRVGAGVQDGFVSITLENPYDSDCEAPKGLGMGVRQVHQRIATRFGADGRMEIDGKNGRHSVRLVFPMTGKDVGDE